MSDPIKKIELAGGKVRYRFVVDIGRDPKTGRRRQLTKTYDTKKEARAAYAKILHQTEEGTFVAPAKMTVREWLGDLAEIGDHRRGEGHGPQLCRCAAAGAAAAG